MVVSNITDRNTIPESIRLMPKLIASFPLINLNLVNPGMGFATMPLVAMAAAPSEMYKEANDKPHRNHPKIDTCAAGSDNVDLIPCGEDAELMPPTRKKQSDTMIIADEIDLTNIRSLNFDLLCSGTLSRYSSNL